MIRRVGAYLCDIFVLFVVFAPLGYLVQRTLGVVPSTAPGVYVALVLNFSVPSWTYFGLADRSSAGATIGKRLFALRTESTGGGRVETRSAAVRTAIKMMPWEVAHVSSFLLAPGLGQLAAGNWAGIGLSYLLSFVYLFVAWRNGGERSVHDVVAATAVRRSAS